MTMCFIVVSLSPSIYLLDVWQLPQITPGYFLSSDVTATIVSAILVINNQSYLRKTSVCKLIRHIWINVAPGIRLPINEKACTPEVA
jgi:hypothetical protein